MRNFGKKWFISASNGILGKTLLVALCLRSGFVGGQYISIPIDKDILELALRGYDLSKRRDEETTAEIVKIG